MVLERFEIIYFLGKQSLKKFLNNSLVSLDNMQSMERLLIILYLSVRNNYFIVFEAGFILFV